jgi:N-methylhydantoinase A
VRCRHTSGGDFRLAEVDAPRDSGRRKVSFPGHGWIDTPVRRLDRLPEGEVSEGPAILESPFTTVVIDPAARYLRQPSGSLVVFP